MSQMPPDRYGLSDEQWVEVEQATSDLGLNHEIVEGGPHRRDTLDERLRREARDRERARRSADRLVAPGAGIGPDWTREAYAVDVGPDSGDLSAEERAIHIEYDR
ncbi:DUF5709 domain-containing protein [Planobispora rosea]|uniref:DUF5709 domain-containing protein n=1 Tax=Planobispora rosea TaxID=35762 RepID=UPI00083B57FF|nr:DUF5709 domain-containing protein [Planobispora rosea]